MNKAEINEVKNWLQYQADRTKDEGMMDSCLIVATKKDRDGNVRAFFGATAVSPSMVGALMLWIQEFQKAHSESKDR